MTSMPALLSRVTYKHVDGDGDAYGHRAREGFAYRNDSILSPLRFLLSQAINFQWQGRQPPPTGGNVMSKSSTSGDTTAVSWRPRPLQAELFR
jgi:hypothetical protein